MSEQDNACRAPMHYIATARAYWLDLAAMAFVFVCVSIATGRVWRFPFDDEIATLSKIEPSSVHELIATFFSTDDIHPPFSYLLFYALRQLGFSDPGMRLCSLAMSCVALGLCQILVLNWLSWRETSERLPSPTRIVAVLIFGLMPLMVNQGDALRWYPVFAVLVAAAAYPAPRHEPKRLWSAAALGLAASTDFSAALLVPPVPVLSACPAAPLSLVVRSVLLVDSGRRRHDRLLLRLLDFHSLHRRGTDRIFSRRDPFRSDRRAGILRATLWE